MEWFVEIVVMGVMIAINAVFAAFEIALASISLARLQRLESEKKPGASAARSMKQNMEASLAVVQLGITLVGTIAAAVGGAGAEEKIAPWLSEKLHVSSGTAEFLALAGMVLPLTMATILIGELIPKVFALRNAEWVCLRLAPVMRWFAFSVWPVVWLFETIVTWVMSFGQHGQAQGTAETATLQELRANAALARASRLIGHREENIILSASAFAARPVREIMLPAPDISTLYLHASLADNLIAAHLDMHTRFPVVAEQGNPQTIRGYVNVKDMIAVMHLAPDEPSLQSILRPLPSLKPEQPIADCLEQLMREHQHIALVRDGETIVGMVALEDILEELVGDIHDEFDKLPAHVIPSGKGWVVGGGTTLERLRELTQTEFPTKNDTTNTLAAWLAERLGQTPQGGATLEWHGLRLLVRKVRRQQVQEAQITRIAHDATGVR